MKDKDALPCGVHLLTEFDIARRRYDATQRRLVFMFFWPNDKTFDVRFLNRTNISCMFTKVLSSLSATVIVPLSVEEVCVALN